MKGIIHWFAANGVVANLLMALLVVAGLVTIPGMKREVFPEIEVESITVSVAYRGAAPEEVAAGVLVRIEEAVQSLDGIRRIVSSAKEGLGTVTIEAETGYDLRRLLDDVKTQVDAIETFPIESEKPVIRQALFRNQVINISVSGQADDRTLRLLGERVRDDVLRIDGITQVDLKYARPYEIAIEVSEKALRRHGLTFDEVAGAVRRSSLDLPGGSVRTEQGEILLRTLGQAYVGAEFDRLTLLTRADGSRLTIADIGRVVDGFEENDKWARFDGKPAVLVQIYRVGDQSALDIVAAVHEYVSEMQRSMPERIELTTWQDSGEVLRSRIDLLTRNALSGLVLVFVVLSLFLKPKLAFWVSLGIPISFLGAFALLPWFGVSINMVSLFAFILVLGIVVDDAIVVGESIYSVREEGAGGLQSAVRGTRRVAVPVIFGVATTMAAFAPIFFIEGPISKMARVIPIVVILSLAFSLIESQLVLPHHLSRLQRRRQGGRGGVATRVWEGFFDLFSASLNWLIERVFSPFLDLCLRWRYSTLAASMVVLMLTAALVQAGRVKFVFMEMDESNSINIELTMPLETSVEVTGAAISQIEQDVARFRREVEHERGERLIRHVLSSAGETVLFDTGPGDEVSRSATYLGGVAIELVPSQERNLSSEEAASLLRRYIRPVAGAVELTIRSSGFGAGEGLDIQLAGPSIEKLRIAADELKEELRTFQGVTNVGDSFRGGKPEIKLTISSKAESLGLSLQDLGRQVRQGFFGEEAQRIQRGRDDVRVMVRYPAEERDAIGDLADMRIRTPDGGQVPFSTVARAEMSRGFSDIRRVDREPAISVTADIDPAFGNSNEVLAKLEEGFLPQLMERYFPIIYSLEGQSEDEEQFVSGAIRGFGYIILVIYGMIAIPFRSYIQPLLVLSAVPFGVVGAVWGHAIMGYSITVLSMMGVVAVAGVVVNGSLVLVSFVNANRGVGKRMLGVVREAAKSRFRPVLLTSLTTAAGIAPLMLERSVQAQFLIPMAVSIAFGVLFATVISLVIVPAGYLVLDDLRRAALWLRGENSEAR